MEFKNYAEINSKNIGENTFIWQYTVILPGAKIGKECNINSHCFIENDVTIGDRVTIKCGVYIWDGIKLDDDVFIGPNVTFINDKFPRSKHPFEVLITVVKKGASIGAGATILPGITIGEYSMIGAGSVLTRSTSNNTLWVGNPARFIGYICQCGQRLDNKFNCIICNQRYILNNNKVVKK